MFCEVRIDSVACFGGLLLIEIRVLPAPGLIVDPLIIPLDLLGRVGRANEIDDVFKS